MDLACLQQHRAAILGLSVYSAIVGALTLGM